ncbi:MAG: hypothetical protein WC413_03675 [Candidatus Nanoarchaeia archaeon]
MTTQELDLIQVFRSVLGHQQPIYEIKSKFINILKDQSSFSTQLSKEECSWMIHNIDCIENVINSKKAVAVLWYLHKYKESYIQHIARCLRSYTAPVRYWVDSYKQLWLVEERQSTFRKDKIYYHLNHQQYPNIIGIFVTLIKEKYGEEFLDNMVRPNLSSNNTIEDKQYNAIRKIRNAN